MNLCDQLSVRRKLTLISLAASAASLVLVCGAFLAYNAVQARKELVRQSITLADIIGYNNSAALMFGDMMDTQNTLDELRTQPNIVAAALYVTDGTAIAAYRGPAFTEGERTPAVEPDGWEIADGRLRLFRDIERDGNRIGAIHLEVDLAELRRRTRLDLMIAAAALACAVLVAIGLSARLQRLISAPILHLVDTANAIARDQDYSKRATRTTNDELGLLVDRFNNMLEQIEGRDQEITEARDHLERKVNERTAELSGEVAERRRAQVDLISARDAAEAASRAKSEFLATMSHEIRTPMNGVIGMTNVLLGSELTREQRDHLSTVNSSADALLAIINDILDFSKIEAGRLHFETLDFDLAETLETTLELLSERASSRGNTVAYHLPGKVTAGLRGDPGRLRQVVLNLVGNAIKFTENGRVDLHVTQIGSEDGRVMLKFEVTDTGIGIPEDAQAKLFQPFTQADSSTTRRFGGTGLGLAISKRLVELMGGKIGLRSVEREGSTFWFTAGFGLRQAAPESLPTSGKSRNSAQTARSLRVLVAEDNSVNQKVAMLQLRKLGHKVDVVANGAEAIRALEQFSYDVILMDCHMPEMDGYEATRQIRSTESMRDVRIIAMTANAMQGDREKCLEVGMDDYVTKPVKLELLCEALNRASDEAMESDTAPDLAQPVVDVSVIESLRSLSSEGGPDESVECIRLFMGDALREIGRLEEAFRSGDRGEVTRLAHGLKGSCRNLGVLRMAEVCHRLETSTFPSPAQVYSVRAEFEQASGILKEQLENRSSGVA